MEAGYRERVAQYYSNWAATYGEDDGLFAVVRRREQALVHRLLALRGGESFLDAGCGSGIYSRTYKDLGHEVWATDLSAAMLERVRPIVDHAWVGDIDDLALGRTFDRILCLGVMEFVENPKKTLVSLRKHLGANGRLVVLAPKPSLGGRVYRALKARSGIGVHLHSRASLAEQGARAGLRVVASTTPFFHNFILVFENA